MIEGLSSLLGKVLVVVPHQDDEIACAVLLQRARGARVIFATDGAPASEFFWGSYGSRQRYAEVRRAEAIESLGVIGIAEPIFLQNPVSSVCFQDQDLFCSLPMAMEALEEVVTRLRPDTLLAPAYEGGHPDHDACSFLTSVVGHSFSISRWEMPFYHRSRTGTLVHQEVRLPLGSQILLHPSELELRRRTEMLSKYSSQPDLTRFVSSRVERIRPQPTYDYTRPPHTGALNYEVWEWPMTGLDLCAAFMSCGVNQVSGG